MARYFSSRSARRPIKLRAAPKPCAPRADWWDDVLPMRDLYVPDHEAVDTGLIDMRGDAIMRAPNPMGFGKDEEW